MKENITHYIIKPIKNLILGLFIILIGFSSLVYATNFYEVGFEFTTDSNQNGNTQLNGIVINVTQDLEVINITKMDNTATSSRVWIYNMSMDLVSYAEYEGISLTAYFTDTYLFENETYVIYFNSVSASKNSALDTSVSFPHEYDNVNILAGVFNNGGEPYLLDNLIYDFRGMIVSDIPTPCNENWVLDNTTKCILGNKLILYNDLNSCGTYESLPVLNGSSEVCPQLIQITNIPDPKFDFSDSFLVHIFFWFFLFIILYLAFYSTGYFKFLYAIGGILLFGYTKYLSYTLFIDNTSVLGYAEYWIMGSFYIMILLLLYMGIWSLFNPKNR